MKKILILTTAAALMLCSCAKTPEQVREAVADPEEIVDDGTPVPITFGSNVRLVETKTATSAGAVESWNGDDLYIFGIKRVSASSPELDLTAAGRFIDNVLASAPAPANPGDVVLNGAIDVYRIPATQEYFYYKPNVCYDFFGYYIDDAESTGGVKYEADKIYRDIVIDGTQDILLAKTDKAADIEAGYTGAAANKPSAASVYSAFSARKGIHPNLIFNHQLSRFRFFVESGYDDDVDGSGVHSPGRPITIDGLTLNTPTKGRLVIASNDQDNHPEGLEVDTDDASFAALPLYIGTANNLHILDKADGIKPMKASQELEGSILAMPGQAKYDVNISLVQEGYSEGNVIVPLTVDFSKLTPATNYENSGVAKAGYQYNVNIIVWGLEKVEVKVTLTEWKDGGDFILDPDDDPAA